MTAWMLYAVAISALFSVAASAGQRALALYRRPTRWVWALSLVASAAMPTIPRLIPHPSTRPMTGGVLIPSGDELWRTPLGVIEQAGVRTMGLDAALLGLWLVMSLALSVWLAWSYLRLRRERATWATEVVDGSPVFVSPDVGPAVIDPIGGAIVMPRWLLHAAPDVQRLALAHERSHVAAGDATLVCSALLVVMAMPWNPVLWWQLHRLRIAVELDCDRRLLAAGAHPRAYAELLLQLASDRGMALLQPGLVQPRSVVERRISAMIDRRVRVRLTRSIGYGAVAAGLIFVACDIRGPQEPSRQKVESEIGPALTSLEAPGESMSIEVVCADRCTATFDPKRKPLFIVDDAIMSTAPDLGALEVETLEVVKSSAAEALYGKRARHGVIRITTKKN